MTYASFGHWQGSLPASYGTPFKNRWFIYGFHTPDYVLSNRTGTASYSGVAYGSGIGSSGKLYDVTGTSNLSVDFSSHAFNGALALLGRNTGTSDLVDFGSTAFAGIVDSRSNAMVGSFIAGGGGYFGDLYGQFYGPQGREIAGTYAFTVPQGAGAGTSLTGAFAATQK